MCRAVRWGPAHWSHWGDRARQTYAEWPHLRQVEHWRAVGATVQGWHLLVTPANETDVDSSVRATEALSVSLTRTCRVAARGSGLDLGKTNRGFSVMTTSFQAGCFRRKE